MYSNARNLRCVFQWKLELDDSQNKPTSDKDTEAATKKLDKGGPRDQTFFEAKAFDDADAAPWRNALVPPADVSRSNPAAPDRKLELEYVYGYQGQCARNNVYYNDAGGIVYHTAAVGIVYDKNLHSQVWMNLH